MSDNRRRSRRVPTRFETLYDSSREQGRALLCDVSHVGALFEESSARPTVGETVRIYLYLRPPVRFELEGRVVRHTEDGFAVEYGAADLEACRLANDAAALVSVPRIGA